MKPRVWMSLIAGAVVLLGGSCIGYPMVKMRWAERQVREFCDEVVVGGPIDGLEARAGRRWLHVIDLPQRAGEPGELLFWQGWLFSRHFCQVHHVGGVVTEKKTTYLD